MKNFIQKGECLDVNSPDDVKSGDLVFVGEIFGVASLDAKPGAPLILNTGGVWHLPKVAAEDYNVGTKVYFDQNDNLVTINQAGGANPLIGVAVKTAYAGAATATVRLNASF